MTTTTVLISEPNASNALVYLPYVWGVLKTAAEREPDLAGRIDWLNPIFLRDTPDALLSGRDLTRINVLGLSCYTWNFDLQCEIAAIVKRANPACVTIAGGPHPEVKDADFLRKHPYIDAVAVKDGEETFTALLRAIVRGERDFRAIGGLYLPHGPDRDMAFTGPTRLPADFAVSPYRAQSETYRRLMADNPAGNFGVIWETNRGCPYSCSFCDWGSNTMSKIRQFDIARVEEDIGWFSSSGLHIVMLADANFGILPRDIGIASHFAERYRANGNRSFFYFSAAKNNPARSLSIYKILLEKGVLFQPTLSIQHTDAVVLDSADRKNISPEKQYAVARELISAGAMVDVQLIMGLPGDNFARWRQCLTQLVKWGLHGDYMMFFFNFLPNAPAADADYRAYWQIRTIRRVVRDTSNGMKAGAEEGIPQEIIVASREFSTDEWVEMNAYTAIFRALHCSGMTRLAAIALHECGGVDIGEFYEAVIGDYLRSLYRGGAIHAGASDIFSDLLTDETLVADQTVAPELGDDNPTLCASQSVLVRIAMDADGFFDGLLPYLLQRFAGVDPVLLASLIDYQRAMVALPDYDPATGKNFALAHDWPAYFADVQQGEMTGNRPPPAAITGMVAAVDDAIWPSSYFPRHPGWVGRSGADKWRQWAIFSMESGQKVGDILHHNVRVEPRPARQATPLSARLAARLRGWLPVRA